MRLRCGHLSAEQSPALEKKGAATVNVNVVGRAVAKENVHPSLLHATLSEA